MEIEQIISRTKALQHVVKAQGLEGFYNLLFAMCREDSEEGFVQSMAPVFARLKRVLCVYPPLECSHWIQVRNCSRMYPQGRFNLTMHAPLSAKMLYGYTDRIVEMTLHQGIEVDPKSIDILSRNHWKSLKVYKDPGEIEDTAHVVDVLGYPMFRQVEHLILAKQRINPDRLASIVRSIHLEGLKCLELADNDQVGPLIGPLLRNCMFVEGLTHLKLCNLNISRDSLKEVLKSLVSYSSKGLTLDLSGNPLDDEDVRALIQSEVLDKVSSLRLDKTKISASSLQMFRELNHPNVQEVFCDCKDISGHDRLKFESFMGMF